MTKKYILYWLESKREEEKCKADRSFGVAAVDNIGMMEPESRRLYRGEIRTIDKRYDRLISSVQRKKDESAACEYLKLNGFDVSDINEDKVKRR